MSSLISLLSGLITAAVGAVAGGGVASLAVDWYHISGREGGAGYFVIAVGLVSLVAGFLVGVVSSRIAGADSPLRFFKGLGLSLGIVATLAGGSVLVTRSLADVPPTIDGESLILMVEVRYPPDQTTSPAADPGEGFVSLGALSHSNKVPRASRRGPLFREDARLVDGRWVVPGAVDVFTGRGGRLLEIAPGSQPSESFLVPLPSAPGSAELQWSSWLPRERPDGTPAINRLTYRFRVQRASEPTKIEIFGPFEIITIARHFHDRTDAGKKRIACDEEYRVRYRGKPLAPDGTEGAAGRAEARINSIALLPGPRPALLVDVGEPYGASRFVLLSDDGARAHAEFVADASDPGAVRELDPGPTAPVAGGCTYLHRSIISRPGLLRIGNDGVVDTRTLAVHRFHPSTDFITLDGVPPLGVSPDQRSFVRGAVDAGRDGSHALEVTDFVGDRSYGLPIDRRRMRYPTIEVLDAGWVMHHFAWQKDEAGVDRLVERSDFKVLPYRGKLSIDADGYREYRLDGGTKALRAALVDFLIAKLGGARASAAEDDYALDVRVGDWSVSVSYSADFHYVAVWTERGKDSAVVAEVAKQFDVALASGEYDGLFEPERS